MRVGHRGAERALAARRRPAQAPLLNALHSTALYLADAASGVIGAAGLALVGPAGLGQCGAVLLVAAVMVAEAAHTAARPEKAAAVAR
jgi:predicted MFS family arabinose efflux permease